MKPSGGLGFPYGTIPSQIFLRIYNNDLEEQFDTVFTSEYFVFLNGLQFIDRDKIALYGIYHDEPEMRAKGFLTIFDMEAGLVLYTDLPKKQDRRFAVYPNPAREQLSINQVDGSPPLLSRSVRIQITSADGKVVRSPYAHDLRERIELNDVASGSYYLTIESDEGREVVPFVKQ
ncbi:MAG: T9SS type A sorting domain-containing protein [Saprospiraceae bacterium]